MKARELVGLGERGRERKTVAGGGAEKRARAKGRGSTEPHGAPGPVSESEGL